MQPMPYNLRYHDNSLTVIGAGLTWQDLGNLLTHIHKYYDYLPDRAGSSGGGGGGHVAPPPFTPPPGPPPSDLPVPPMPSLDDIPGGIPAPGVGTNLVTATVNIVIRSKEELTSRAQEIRRTEDMMWEHQRDG
ncbi:MAG: hypothetical protein AAF841_07430 [Pseudomonadota bacterium]